MQESTDLFKLSMQITPVIQYLMEHKYSPSSDDNLNEEEQEIQLLESHIKLDNWFSTAESME